MRKISGDFWTYLRNSKNMTKADTDTVANGDGIWVKDYADMIRIIASLAFANPQWLLFFRGQKEDYKVGFSTSLLPAIFRNLNGSSDQKQRDLKQKDLKQRFESLINAENLLVQYYDFDAKRRIQRHDILRWAILQHYEIHATPLLDITYSPRVACSFSGIKYETTNPTYVYVLGMPQISGSISVSSEHEIQNIRLLSVCPPTALRPHYQEGHLIGDYPTLSYAERAKIELPEVDFSRRLVCKFRLKPKGKFQTIPDKFLFPGRKKDKVLGMAEKIKKELDDKTV
jgi:hypothetical protein